MFLEKILHPILFTIGNLEIPSSYFFFGLGAVCAILVGGIEAKRVGISRRSFRIFCISGIPLAVLLGGLNNLLFVNGFLKTWQNLDKTISGGLVSFGAIVGILAWGYVINRILDRDQPVGLSSDTIAVILPLFLGIYRIGCLLNGCCYGLKTDSFIGMYLPGQFGVWAYRYPTQIMLLAFNFALFAWLWSRRKKKAFQGSLTLSFLFLYSFGRLIIDAFRDLPRVMGPFSLHQLASIAIILIAGYILFEIRFVQRSKPQIN
jgi:phosphatidylglycerol:prolipoprotein diacylglycerol transferase